MTLDTALETVRSARPQANPNPGFMAQLAALEEAQGDFASAAAAMGSYNRTAVAMQRAGGLCAAADALHGRCDAPEGAMAPSLPTGPSSGDTRAHQFSALCRLHEDIAAAAASEPAAAADDRVAFDFCRPVFCICGKFFKP